MRCLTRLCLLESVLPEGVSPCPLVRWQAFGTCHRICVRHALLASGILFHFSLSNYILGKSTQVLVLNLELRGAYTPLLCDCGFA